LGAKKTTPFHRDIYWQRREVCYQTHHMERSEIRGRQLDNVDESNE
jgi:transposase